MSGVAAAGLLAAGCTGGAGNSAAGGTDRPAEASGTPTPSSATATTSAAATPSPTGSGGGLSPSGKPTSLPPPQPGPGGGTTYQIGPAGSGKTVTMKVGDRLQITLAANRLGALWTLTGYPRAALRLEIGRATFGQFVFVARATGGGNVTLTRAGCTGPYDRPCLDRPEPIDPTPTVAPPVGGRVFTIMVRVV